MNFAAVLMQISILWHAHLVHPGSMPTADQVTGLAGDDYMIITLRIEHSNVGFAIVISKQRS